MRTRIEDSNDRNYDVDTYSIYLTVIASTEEESEELFHDFIRFANKRWTLVDFDSAYCPDCNDNEYCDTVQSGDYDNKAEFVKDVRMLVKEWKKQLNK